MKNIIKSISIVIPVFNEESNIIELLEELKFKLNNKIKYEILVVDDGSTDNTLKMRKQFPLINWLVLNENNGVSFARNRGVDEAKGDWIAFLDSDDLWEKKRLAAQFDWIESHPESQALHTDEIWIRNGVRVNSMKKHQKYAGDIFRYCLPLCIVSPSSVILRAELLKKMGGFDESMPVCEDYDLWLRIASHYLFDYIDEKLIIKRGGHEDQLSRKYWGMDRWRVYTLNKLLKQGTLKEDQKEWTKAMLIEKCGILINGFNKRGKKEEARYYQGLASGYSSLVGNP